MALDMVILKRSARILRDAYREAHRILPPACVGVSCNECLIRQSRDSNGNVCPFSKIRRILDDLEIVLDTCHTMEESPKRSMIIDGYRYIIVGKADDGE